MNALHVSWWLHENPMIGACAPLLDILTLRRLRSELLVPGNHKRWTSYGTARRADMCASMALIPQSCYKERMCEKTHLLMAYTLYVNFDFGLLGTWPP